MSVINSWGGDLWSTSFDLVIFSRGKVFKKTIGPDGKSTWAKIFLRGGDLYWSYCGDSPEIGSECANIHSLWWNTVSITRGPARGGDGDHSLCFFVGPKDNCLAWSCQYKGSDSSCLWSTPNWSPLIVDDLSESHELYWGSMPLTELGTLQNVDDPLEDGGKRIDPYERRIATLYSKKEFSDYYGSTLEWNMMSPEKILKRQMIGTTIAENSHLLSQDGVNHLLDKYIETFL